MGGLKRDDAGYIRPGRPGSVRMEVSMRKLMCAAFMLVAVGCYAKPEIKFDTTEHDFGTHRQEKNLKHVFTFTNGGTSTLVIDKVTAG